MNFKCLALDHCLKLSWKKPLEKPPSFARQNISCQSRHFMSVAVQHSSSKCALQKEKNTIRVICVTLALLSSKIEFAKNSPAVLNINFIYLQHILKYLRACM